MTGAALRPTVAILALTLMMSGCGAMNRTAKGGTIGAGAGGVLGGVIGKQSGNTTAGVLIGVAVGGLAGAAIGRYMDRQAEELRQDLENARVERVGEGIKITFPSGILFSTDSSSLQAPARENLTDLASTLKKYDDTRVLVQGHTDSTGSDTYNLGLSVDRARSVSQFLQTVGIPGGRIETEGHGETLPAGSNDTAAGRRNNRRVEVAIYANERLKKAAQDGKI